jgi:uncharacterized membrane protein YeaQ/YmgE (transglycosylase-associated protein family)
MGILTWIIVGLIAGWLAGLVVRGSGYGLLGDIIVGIVGALIGGFLASVLLGVPNPLSGFDLRTLAVAFGGSVVLIVILRAVSGRRVVCRPGEVC